MSLKLIHIGVFVIPILMSVVHNIEIEPNETILSEISSNISRVNHVLQDLMKKYDLLKHLIQTQTYKINHNKNKYNDFVTMKTHFKIRAKEKIKESKKTFRATESYTDQSTEDNDSGIHKKKKLKEKKVNIYGHYRPGDTEVQLRYPPKSDGIGKTLFFTDASENDTNETYYKGKPREKKVFGIKDTVSSDSHEDTFVTKKYQRTTQKKNKLQENLKQQKITNPRDYLDDEIIRGTTKESDNTKDVQKVLVIHIGNTNSNVNLLRTSNPNEVKIPSTKMKQRTTESTTHTFKSDITTDPNSDIEEHKAMQEEILRAKTLRHELGDACVLLVVRKCKKALKDVLKDVCKRSKKCSSKFNTDFTANGIAACDEEFNKPKGKKGRNYDDDDSENDDHGQDEDEELTGANSKTCVVGIQTTI
ncbi:uncharacterized protein LOC134675718 [Cydia fagiglandana]|uniref:uncharacterized protein LOC134675718 n=1 Tax=Cydia fagiglandana TaxID=1458189 RepID=UPI002FEE0B6A